METVKDFRIGNRVELIDMHGERTGLIGTVESRHVMYAVIRLDTGLAYSVAIYNSAIPA